MKPGLYPDISDADYHGHRLSLTATGAKKLLPPSCPAKFKASLGEDFHSDALDFGKGVHRILLGKGADVVEIPYASYQGDAAQEMRAVTWAAGNVPLLTKHIELAENVAAAVRRHHIAGPLFQGGDSEVSAFWEDDETGVMRRCRFDYLPEVGYRPRLLIPDLKTARSSEPYEFGRAVADYGYFMSAAWYIDGAKALGLDPNPAFLLVAVEKVEPFVVTVMQLDREALDIGRAMNRKALHIFKQCTETDVWPGYSDEIETVSLPGYFTYRAEEIAS